MAWNKPVKSTEGTKSFADIMREQISDASLPSGLLPPGVAASEELCIPGEDTEQPPIDGPQSSDDFALAVALQQMEDEEMTNASERRQLNPNNAFEKIGVVSRYNTQTVFRHSTSQSKSNTNHVSMDYIEAKRKQAELAELGVDLKGNGMAMLSTGQVLTKHDAQLNGLNNASKLTELQGVGDMEGILVNNSVANSIRSFTQKKGR